MEIQLTQQERKVLQDHMQHEEVCIQKYDQYAQETSDPQLKSMFNQFAQQERQHYNSLDQLLQGKQPATGGQSGQNQGQGRQTAHARKQTRQGGGAQGNNSDALMCRDAMMMEKFISDSYDNGIFDSTNPVVRQTLQHIQDEEQQHGEGLLNYLHQHGLQG